MKGPHYVSGEPILAGDVIEYFGDRGHVEFAVSSESRGQDLEWFLATYGQGVMLQVPSMGRVFLLEESLDDSLRFASRGSNSETGH